MSNGGHPVPQPQRPAAPQIPIEYQRSRELIDALWNDGEVGPKIRAAAKARYPDVNLPDDTFKSVIDPLRTELNDLKKTLADEREQRAKERKEAEEKAQTTTVQQALDNARKNYNLTDEGFDKMVARMKETGNYTDADAAAAWVISKEPPPKPPGATWAPQRINVTGVTDDEAVKLLHKDPEAYQDRVLNEFIADPDKFVAETFGRT